MEAQADAPRQATALRPGELVRIRTEAEILATLDATGRLDGLPFMPEMLRHCGKTARVFKRADKTCDSVWVPGMRTMTSAVFLWGLRCDGDAHGGCQAGCLFFWKEEWLTRSTEDGETDPGPGSAAAPASTDDGRPRVTPEDLLAATRVDANTPDETFRCQATEVANATTPLSDAPWWDIRQYGPDMRSGNVGPAHVALVMSKLVASSLRYRLSMGRPRRRQAPGDVASRDPLNLQPGDRVRVRSRQEIESTLGSDRLDRGLSFTEEMVRYCGGEFTVLRRVDRIIHEQTGKMLTLRDCIILDGATCQGDFHAFCQRNVYVYWREAWLRRLD